MTEQQPPAGWYPQGNEERYWDGAQWTDQRRPLNSHAPQPQPAYYQQPKKSHTARNILIGLAVLFVVFVGGCFAVVGLAANEADKALDHNNNKAGGANNAMTVKEGEAFEVDGFEYAAGWRIAQKFGMFSVEGLKVTNQRDNRDSALVDIKLWKGSEILAVSSCTTEPIEVGTTTRVDCLPADKMPKTYDKVTINDMF